MIGTCVAASGAFGEIRNSLPQKKAQIITAAGSRFEEIIERIKHRLTVMHSEIDEVTWRNCLGDQEIVARLLQALLQDYPELS